MNNTRLPEDWEALSPGQIQWRSLPPDPGFALQTGGRGYAAACPVFPGVVLAVCSFLAESFQLELAQPLPLLWHCAAGGIACPEDPSGAFPLHPGDCTLVQGGEKRRYPLPAGYARWAFLILEAETADAHLPEPLRQAGVSLQQLARRLERSDAPLRLPEPLAQGLFSLPSNLPQALLPALLQLKAQEALLYCSSCLTEAVPPEQCGIIHQIHDLMVAEPQRRFTIEELSRRYLINTTSLKEGFKQVYGLPIATYMKRYRICRAMELLRQTQEGILEIAARVGYRSASKFARAFEEEAGLSPSEYRRLTKTPASGMITAEK